MRLSGNKKVQISYLSSELPEHACPTIRVFSPFKRLEHRYVLKPANIANPSRASIRKNVLYNSDIILIQRTAFLNLPVRELKSPWRKIVYEIDDYLLDIPEANPAKSVMQKYRVQIIEAIKNADLVTVSTDVLKEKLSRYNENIFVLPNYIDLDIWGTDLRNPDNKEDNVVIGFMGTPTHQRDLDLIIPAVKKIQKEYPKKVIFKFFGCVTEELLQLEGVEFVNDLIPDYKTFAKYMKGLSIDIALAPLARNAFNECKSNIKFLEYSICQIPGIYSKAAPYKNSVIDGDTGLLCDNETECWYRAMKKLIEHKEYRKKMGRDAFKEVINKYSIDSNAYKLHDLYEILLGKKEKKIITSKAMTKNPSLRVQSKDGSIRILHSLYDPEAEARLLVDKFQFNGEGILVVLGLGLGYHIVELIKKFPNSYMIVVESVPEIYELARKYGSILQISGKVKYIVGYPPKEAISEITMQQIKSLMPPIAVFPLPSALSAFPQYYEPILDKLTNAARLSIKDKLKYPKFKSNVMKIILIDFDYFLTKELEKVIKRLGHDVVKIKGGKNEIPAKILGRLTEAIVDLKPDFVFTLNHLGFDEDGIIASFFESIEMPVASWYVDSPNIIVKAFDKNASPYVSLFLWDKKYIKDMKSMGFESVTYLPLGTDEQVFKPLRCKTHKRKKYSENVGFVGNSMVTPTNEKLEKVSKEFHPIIHRLAKKLSSTRTTLKNLLKHLNKDDLDKINTLTPKEKVDFEGAILWEATLLYRLSCIKMLSNFNPTIHGDDRWAQLLNGKYSLHPPLHYYTELPQFYNTCKINFNATSLQMLEAVNQRVFDVPACNAFILTDHQKDIEDLFEVGKEVVTYREPGQIPKLVKFYLNHPSERKTIARKGRERVLREHTYKHRLNTIIEVMRKRYG